MADCRETPAFHVWMLLKEMGAHVCYHDPFVPEIKVKLPSAFYVCNNCNIATTATSPYNVACVLLFTLPSGGESLPRAAERHSKREHEGGIGGC